MNYNFIYSKLVTNKKDFIGLVAYSLYKQQKIEYLEKCKLEKGSYPEGDEMLPFIEFTSSDTQIQQYRRNAEKDVEDFATELLKDKVNEIEAFYQDALKRSVEQSGHGYWYGVSQGVFASLLYTLLLGLILIVLWSTTVGPREIIEKVFDVKVIPVSTKVKDQP